MNGDRTIFFRPIRPEDEDFLRRVYAETRAKELAAVEWSEVEKDRFVEMQFMAQHTFYLEQFKSAEFNIILLDDRAVGRLYLDRREDEIRIIDIALLPEYRNNGLGTTLIRDILRRGEEDALPVRIHVEQFNPALRLYDRLGFKRVRDNGVHCLMQWIPGQTRNYRYNDETRSPEES